MFANRAMMTLVQSVGRDELLKLVDERHNNCAFVDWAEKREANCESMYLSRRSDISDAQSSQNLLPV